MATVRVSRGSVPDPYAALAGRYLTNDTAAQALSIQPDNSFPFGGGVNMYGFYAPYTANQAITGFDLSGSYIIKVSLFYIPAQVSTWTDFNTTVNDLRFAALGLRNGDTTRFDAIYLNQTFDFQGFMPDATGVTGADDRFVGGYFNDLLRGVGGNDLLYGLTGDDRIEGGYGNDALYGGVGDDTITGDAGMDIIHGEDGNDTINAGSDDDYVSGGAGIDTIALGDGNDGADGGAGDDVISGGNGVDGIIGGNGADTMTGGASGDYFIYTAISQAWASGTETDFIVDFNRAQGDRIDLSAIDTNPLTVADEGFTIGAPGAGRIQLVANAALGVTQIILHLDGDGIADGAIVVTGIGLTASDFIL